MPTGKLPSEPKKLWEDVYDKALKGSCKGDKECAARTAWSVIKKNWKEDEKGNWTRKAELSEFALTIKRVSIDPATNEKLWKADTSDTIKDSRDDNMTIDLFRKFTERISKSDLAPEEYRSDFWDGGMPYLSVSHYSHQNGQAVPGDVKAVYIDGRFLKAKGNFYDTPLGNAAWQALMDDKASDRPDKVRISIGFLDYGHIHKSNNFKFERKSLDDICTECLKEIITEAVTGEKSSGKAYVDGMLVHLAMTRVPVNTRTSIVPDLEVKAEMITRKDDAASIVGELAEEIDEAENKLKSKSLVEFSEAEVEEAKTKKDEKVPADEETPAEDMDEDEMKEKDKKKKMKAETELSELLKEVREMKSVLQGNEPTTPVIIPELDEVQKSELYPIFKAFVNAYEQVQKSELPEDEKLRTIQAPFNELGEAIVAKIKKPVEVQKQEPQDALVKALSEVMTPIAQKLDLLLAQQSQPMESRIPSRRSLSPSVVAPVLLKSEAEKENAPTGKGVSIADFAKRSTGLQ